MVEHLLAKEGVEGSNPFSRSSNLSGARLQYEIWANLARMENWPCLRLLAACIRDPNFLPLVRDADQLLLREWRLVLKGDGKSPKTIEKYGESTSQLATFLAKGNFPVLTVVTAEHLREWLAVPS